MIKEDLSGADVDELRMQGYRHEQNFMPSELDLTDVNWQKSGAYDDAIEEADNVVFVNFGG